MTQTAMALPTEADYLANPEAYEGLNLEFVDGKAVDVGTPGHSHGQLLLELHGLLREWNRKLPHRGRLTGGDSRFRLGSKTFGVDLAWTPDSDPLPETLDHALPLMVEVVSPSNDADHLMIKTRTYLEFGAKEVWWMFIGETRAIQVFQPDLSSKSFAEPEKLTTPLLAGFELDLRELYEVLA